MPDCGAEYLDLDDYKLQAVKITAGNWKTAFHPPGPLSTLRSHLIAGKSLRMSIISIRLGTLHIDSRVKRVLHGMSERCGELTCSGHGEVALTLAPQQLIGRSTDGMINTSLGHDGSADP